MPTSKKVESIKRLGIIAGGGQLPFRLVEACKQNNIEPFVIALKGQTDDNLIKDISHQWVSLGSAGKIINFFKSNDVTDLVMIGSVQRPSLSQIKPDLRGVQILTKIGFKSLGDNQLLEILEQELKLEGFTLHGIHDFCNELLAPSGAIGEYKPTQSELDNIEVGIVAAQRLGELDIGQSVIVQQGIVIAVEGAEGTDELIKRSKILLKKGDKGILVKTKKPQQSKHLDLPTIGIDTIENAYNAGLAGIAIHANNVLITNIKDITERANKYKLFIYGVDI